MHVWVDLIVRELLFAALLAALGAGPAAFAGERFNGVARAALAPVLGLCLGACLTVTLAYAFPARDTAWVLVAVAALSLAIALWRRPHILNVPDARGALAMAIVALVVLGGYDYPLASRHTVGPIGGFQVADTSGYVSETDALARQSLHAAQVSTPPYSDLLAIALANYARGTQQLDISALEANVNSLLGLGATDTQAPFLIAVLLTGALGAFAVTRAVTRREWPAVLAGCLFAGPAFSQLVIEGSQAAISGSAVLTPTIALGLEAIRRRSVANLALAGLAAAGLQTVYPLFVPSVVIGATAVIAAAAVRSARRRRPTAREAGRAAGALLVVLVCAVVFTPVAFSRNATYWLDILRGALRFDGLPPYRLAGPAVPGWLLQTRDFYGLVNPLHHAGSATLLAGVAIPLVLLAVIALGVWRNRAGLAMCAVAGGAIMLAYYTWTSESCGYCVQRNLIPVAALIPSALAVGLGALAVGRRGGDGHHAGAGRWAAALIALLTVVIVGHEAIVLRQRMSQADYMLDPGARQALAKLPAGRGRVELEGFSENAQAPMELPLVYNLVDERTAGRVSLPTITNDNAGLAYLTAGPVPLGLSFTPQYRYVLTRFAGVATDRRTLARFGPISLQRRLRPLDVTVLSGISVATARLDPGGRAWLSPSLPVQFLVTGSSSRPAWVSLSLRATVPVTALSGAAMVRRSRRGDVLRVCLRARGTGPVRSAAVSASFSPQPPFPSPGRYYVAQPARGLALTAMTVLQRSCAGR